MNLNPGRRSPVLLSPSGRRSPGFQQHDQLRSPLDFPGFGTSDRKSPTTLFPERRSPTTSTIQIQGRRSPLGFYEPAERRSPTSTVHVQDRSKSPLGFMNGIDEGRRSPTVQVQGRRSPIGFSQGLITCIPIVTPTEKRSPIGNLQIPPITVSNPSETCAIIEKTLESSTNNDKSPCGSGGEHGGVDRSASPVLERKERSVMRDILAFVRKPSKKACSSPSTRTGRFAAAFSRAESGSGTPLLRQSTFSATPASSSRAAKSAVTKQLSEASFEPKISFKLLNSKMSLRLRRSTAEENRKKDKKSSGDEMSDMDSSDSKCEKGDSSSSGATGGGHFELENVRFEKVGDSYIKHDKIREETLEDASPSPVQIVPVSENIAQLADSLSEMQPNGNWHMPGSCDEVVGTDTVELLKAQLSGLVSKPEPIYANLLDIKASVSETDDNHDMQIQCPTFEIMPPSRRSSFDPPRSPYLEALRSPCDTDPELMMLNRGDSGGGDSFDLVDTDKNRESSFESRYPSSSHTSFDISRYQSTSYDDQTSSFEIIDLDNQKSLDDKRSPIDLRKSSIELVDIETFQKSEMAGRKSSLETHFDYQSPSSIGGLSGSLLRAKRQVSEPNRCRDCSPNITMKTYYSAPNRARSPLSNQTSSNYSSRDSYDSSFEPVNPPKYHHALSVQPATPTVAVPQPPELKSPFADKSKQHFPLLIKANSTVPTDSRAFLCTDQRCSAIFEPRPGRAISQYLGQATCGHEFEPPSPRRAASASPKHTFTFRIVLKKVDSSPDAICPSAERRRSRDRTERLRRRDSRKKRLLDAGKSF